ncbi:MAG TPA: pitrilysin family protein [Syntrophales bacterium]|nr:pitrilysin family protein [Syntrophales bacterium]
MMSKSFVGILTKAILFTLTFTSIPSAVISYELEKKILSYTLNNGLKVLMMERHLSPTISFYIRHRVGAIDEDDGRTGTAHLLEHMMFKGTKTIGTKNFKKEVRILRLIAKTGENLDAERMKGKYADKNKIESLTKQMTLLQQEHKKLFVENEIDRLYTENGADHMNANTGLDLTTFHVSLPSNRIELWARIEADRMTSPVFREFYSERNVIMEERKQRVDSDPQGQLYEQFLATAYVTHPYRRPILGWPSDLQFLSIVYTADFFKRYYAPNNTVIAIVGDIDPAKTIRIVNKYFGSIPRRTLNSSPITEEPPQKGERRVSILADVSPKVIIAYHKPAMPDFDDYVFDVIECLLSRGRTSKFYKSLIEENSLVESIQATNGVPGAKYPNLFVISAKPRHPHTSAEVEMSIYDEIEKLKLTAISKRELNKAKNQIKADFIRSLETNSGLANMLSYFEIIAGDYRYVTDHIKVIEKITPEDITRVAKKYLIPENRTVANLINKN